MKLLPHQLVDSANLNGEMTLPVGAGKTNMDNPPPHDEVDAFLDVCEAIINAASKKSGDSK